ncbi:MAG TPA: TIGR03435 family protein, partial [Acidobacteriaceae bacterium]|nr:TIGR03435 family protein [Acidobacteriaceae bacterium]
MNLRFGAAALLLCPTAIAWCQHSSFAVATIRPSAADVKFEHDGSFEVAGDTLRMKDVMVQSCIKWAYDVQDSQISGPGWIESDRFDITAKADGPANAGQMKIMLQGLLAERFHLAFHREQRKMKALVLSVAGTGAKLKPAAAPDAPPYRENSANGSIAKSMPIREWANFIAGPLQMPVVDETGLTGKYDFVIDFTGYIPEPGKNMDVARPDATGILKAVLHDQLGLNLDGRRAQVEVMVID